jgi:hypothetical protein
MPQNVLAAKATEGSCFSVGSRVKGLGNELADLQRKYGGHDTKSGKAFTGDTIFCAQRVTGK